MRKPLIVLSLILAPSLAQAMPLSVSVTTKLELPALGPCYADCHWEQVLNTDPDPEQTALERALDLLHEPLFMDFTLWCPPPVFVPPTTPPGVPPSRPPGVPPTVPPTEPPTQVSEAATKYLFGASVLVLCIARRLSR